MVHGKHIRSAAAIVPPATSASALLVRLRSPALLKARILSDTPIVYYSRDKKRFYYFHPSDMCEPAEKTPTQQLSPPTHRHGSLAVFVGGDGALAVDVRPGKQCSEQDEHVHGRQESELSDDCGRGGGSRRERCLLAANQPKNTAQRLERGERETARKRFRGEKISEQNASGFWKTFFPNGLVCGLRYCVVARDCQEKQEQLL